MKYLSEVVRGEVLALLDGMKDDVRELVFHGGPLDDRFTIPRETIWQPLPGRDGVTFFNVPADDGGADLYAAHFCTAAGASYSGSLLDCSRLLVVSEGLLLCNGHIVRPGESVWLDSGEPTSWHSTIGCRGAVFYNVACPEHAIIIPYDLP